VHTWLWTLWSHVEPHTGGEDRLSVG
jgi:hypothetical protein